jgi:hypothetical protein
VSGSSDYLVKTAYALSIRTGTGVDYYTSLPVMDLFHEVEMYNEAMIEYNESRKR